MSLLLALFRHVSMSAFRSLSGGKQTCLGRSILVANDPSATLAARAAVLLRPVLAPMEADAARWDVSLALAADRLFEVAWRDDRRTLSIGHTPPNVPATGRQMGSLDRCSGMTPASFERQKWLARPASREPPVSFRFHTPAALRRFPCGSRLRRILTRSLPGVWHDRP